MPWPTSVQEGEAAQVRVRGGWRGLWLYACSCRAYPPLPAPVNLHTHPPAGDAEATNWLFASDRDALRAMLSLMRSADMDAARLGLQVGLVAQKGTGGGGWEMVGGAFGCDRTTYQPT